MATNPFLDAPRQRRTTSKSRQPDLWACHNRFPLTCTTHGEEISVRCGRWRHCPGCGRRISWQIRQRFLAGIEQVPAGLHANFVTLTFPADRAPDEDAAHRALASLVRRLRYRDQLGAYGWVLHRQSNETASLHHHGIFLMPFLTDDLKEWRELIQASGFGVQNKLVVARPEHAGYCARYISTKLAQLAPLRRAFSFSRTYPLAAIPAERRRVGEVGSAIGLEPECSWVHPAALR